MPAEEIINRLEDMNIDLSSIWAGTIHQFCMRYIIRPYAMYSKRLCKGYQIIDDYCKKKYGHEIAELALAYALEFLRSFSIRKH